jgi:hypothetical protein
MSNPKEKVEKLIASGDIALFSKSYCPYFVYLDMIHYEVN